MSQQPMSPLAQQISSMPIEQIRENFDALLLQAMGETDENEQGSTRRATDSQAEDHLPANASEGGSIESGAVFLAA